MTGMDSPSIYLSGPITGVEHFRGAFAEAERRLARKGWRVVNPAALPQGFTRRSYMAMDLMMMLNCGSILMLPGHEESGGARIEKALAEYVGMQIYYSPEDVPDVSEPEY